MSEFNHPWIEDGLDADEMEAVLVANNEPEPWDAAAVTRCYQTYLWGNAASNGDYPSFAHEETGVIVCHDGNVVGVECGHGSPADALPDLIRVLHSMGWRGTNVYCLAAHKDGVLADIARSVPAHLDFEVHEAKRGTTIAEMPEAQALLDRGRQVLHSLGGGDDETLEMMRNLDQGPMVAMEPPQGVRPAGRIVLEDDELAVVEDALVVPTVEISRPSAISPAIPFSDDVEDGEPRVFDLSAHLDEDLPVETPEDEDVALVAPAVVTPIETTHTTASAGPDIDHQSLSQSVKSVMENRITNGDADESAVQPMSSVNEIDDVPEVNISKEAGMNEPTVAQRFDESRLKIDAMHAIIKVGKSAFFFIEPGQGVSETFIAAVIKFNGFTQNDVIELRPGMLKQPVRWDVLAEIDPDSNPLFALTLADWVISDSRYRATIAKRMIDRRKDLAFADLEDILDFYYNLNPDESCLMPIHLFSRGDSMVGLRVSDNELSPNMTSHFSVRETALSNEAKLYVVHVDALDGPFVKSIANLLRQVVNAYATSDWHRQLVANMAAKEIHVAEKPEVGLSVEAREEMKAIFDSMVARMREFGVDLG